LFISTFENKVKTIFFSFKAKEHIQLMSVNEEDGVRNDIDWLVTSIEATMPHGLLMPPNCCNFKTPVILFRHSEKAFTPKAFSIGPLHHRQSNLKATGKIKAEKLKPSICKASSLAHTLQIQC
jgi:hypothetical protein